MRSCSIQTKRAAASLLASTQLLVMLTTAVLACSSHEEEVCFVVCACVPVKVPDHVDPPTLPNVSLPEPLAQAFNNLPKGEEVVGNAITNVGAVLQHAPADFGNALGNLVNSGDKALSDAGKNFAKGAADLVDAGKVIIEFAEQELRGEANTYNNFQKRFAEGKVVDAFWHVGTEQLQHTDTNAAEATQKSQILNAAAQAVATAYGGAAGASAYAAWKAYHDTGGNVEAAVAAGVLAYVQKGGFGNTGNLPQNTIGQIAKKAAVSGAVSGLAVAASGGNLQDATNAAVQSGGAIILSGAQASIRKTYIDPAVARADTMCVSSSRCAIALRWYRETKQKIDAVAEKKEALKRATVITTKDAQWAISWPPLPVSSLPKNAPTAALIYIGQGSPFAKTLEQIKTLEATKVVSATPYTIPPVQPDVGEAEAVGEQWVAAQGFGSSSSYFSRVIPAQINRPVEVGDILQAKRTINIRNSIDTNMWKKKDGKLVKGTIVVVQQTATLSKNGKSQAWYRFSVIETPPPRLEGPRGL